MPVSTIYYVDDDQDDLYFFKLAIKRIGAEIDLYTYFDSLTFVSELKEIRKTDSLIFLDINMPGKSGFDVLKEIRESSEYKDIPVIIISTSDDPRSIMISQSLGASLYVVKPNDIGDLQAVLQKTININWLDAQLTEREFVMNR